MWMKSWILIHVFECFLITVTGSHVAASKKIEYGDEPVHTLMTKEERRMIFGNHDEKPTYEVVWPMQQAPLRSRRFISEQQDLNENVVIHVDTKEKELRLHLDRRKHLTAMPMKVEIIREYGSEKRFIMDNPDCLYHGKVYGMEDSIVAISTCNSGEMTGVIHLSPEDIYVMVPTPRRLRKTINNTDSQDNVHPHILYKKYKANNTNQNNKIAKRMITNSRVNQRSPRDATDQEEHLNKTIETAIFVDDTLYRILAKENPNDPVEAVLNMVFAMINAVQIIYNQPSLSVDINFVLVQVVILTGSGGPSKGDGDINDYLKSFCKWQARRNPHGDDHAEHWDHALMLTGLDLFMDKPENTIVIGLAWVSGMCNRHYSCSLNEGTTFESVFVISHELGHNLGMQHDGEDNNNECDDANYIMSSSLGPGKTTWSTCSDHYLRKFLSSSTANCLNDMVTPGEGLDHRSNDLPGENYTATVQCRLSFGSKYRPYLTDEEPFEDLCRELWCANGTIARRAHPALVGTRCGTNKLCFHGKCSQKEEIEEDLKSHNLLPENEET